MPESTYDPEIMFKGIKSSQSSSVLISTSYTLDLNLSGFGVASILLLEEATETVVLSCNSWTLYNTQKNYDLKVFCLTIWFSLSFPLFAKNQKIKYDEDHINLKLQ